MAIRIWELLFIVCRNAHRTIYAKCPWRYNAWFGPAWSSKISNLSITGTDAVIKINHLKRVRYCIQVTVCTIYKKIKEAYLKSESRLPQLDKRSTESNMTLVWQLIFNVEILLLLFVQSQREANFQLNAEVLRSFMKYYFARDHYNYGRWVHIHLFDYKTLKFTAPDVFTAFMDGCFTFQKKSTEFSRIPLDQVQEQNNAYIKGVPGATH